MGKAAVREGLAGRFKGMPDVHYGNETHFVAGDTGISTWTVTGTNQEGKKIRANGCDFYTFRVGLAREEGFTGRLSRTEVRTG